MKIKWSVDDIVKEDYFIIIFDNTWCKYRKYSTTVNKFTYSVDKNLLIYRIFNVYNMCF